MAVDISADHEFHGTIRGIQRSHFNPVQDADFLHEAFRGPGLNDKKVRILLTSRNSEQRQEIRRAYQNKFEEDLVERIKSETHGNYEKVLMHLMMDQPHLDAYHAHRAMHGLGTNEDLLTEIICTRTGPELNGMKGAYQEMYNANLVDVVRGETRSDFEKYLVGCLEHRPAEGPTDEHGADGAVAALYKAGEKKWGTDEDKFIEIMSGCSFKQLGLIANLYERQHGKTLHSVIESEVSGDFENALVTSLQHATVPHKYWGQRLRKSMKGLGTDEEALTRILVTRSERDLQIIRDCFGTEFGDGKSLEEWVREETSRKYEKILIAIIQADQREPCTSGHDVSDSE